MPVYQLAINADQMSECLMSESNWSQLASFKAEQDKYCGRYDTLVMKLIMLFTCCYVILLSEIDFKCDYSGNDQASKQF